VGLLRFCFFFGSSDIDPSSFFKGDALKVLSVVVGETEAQRTGEVGPI